MPAESAAPNILATAWLCPQACIYCHGSSYPPQPMGPRVTRPQMLDFGQACIGMTGGAAPHDRAHVRTCWPAAARIMSWPPRAMACLLTSSEVCACAGRMYSRRSSCAACFGGADASFASGAGPAPQPDHLQHLARGPLVSSFYLMGTPRCNISSTAQCVRASCVAGACLTCTLHGSLGLELPHGSCRLAP